MKIEIIDLLEHDSVALKKVTASEYSGPCPVCGGSDRFRVWPDKGRWMCRGCDKSGDVIEYLRHVRGLPFAEAAALAGESGKLRDATRPRRSAPATPKWTPKEEAPPCRAWQEKAEALVGWAHQRLLADASRLEWLEKERGLSLETVKASRLGWNPADVWRDRSTWGLPEERKPDGTPKKLWIPAGLVIPCFRAGAVVRCRIRRPDGEPRYCVVSGSSSVSLMAGSMARAVIVVESELDALLVAQDAAGSVALGSASTRPDAETFAALLSAEAVFIALDSDQAGEKASWGWWRENLPGVFRLPIPAKYGKDPTEAKRAGLPLAEWVLAGEVLRAESLSGPAQQPRQIEAFDQAKISELVRRAGPLSESSRAFRLELHRLFDIADEKDQAGDVAGMNKALDTVARLLDGAEGAKSSVSGGRGAIQTVAATQSILPGFSTQPRAFNGEVAV